MVRYLYFAVFLVQNVGTAFKYLNAESGLIFSHLRRS